MLAWRILRTQVAAKYLGVLIGPSAAASEWNEARSPPSGGPDLLSQVPLPSLTEDLANLGSATRVLIAVCTLPGCANLAARLRRTMRSNEVGLLQKWSSWHDASVALVLHSAAAEIVRRSPAGRRQPEERGQLSGPPLCVPSGQHRSRRTCRSGGAA